MSLPYRARPGMGFIILTIAMMATVIFFGWGWSRPALDRVWQIQLELLLGTRQALASDERRLLQDTLARYPLLAANMLEDLESGLISAHLCGMVETDYAYVVRLTADAPGILTIASPSGEQLELEVHTDGSRTTGEAGSGAPFEWTLPNTGPFPQLTEVRLLPVAEGAASNTKSAGRRRVRPMLIEVTDHAPGDESKMLAVSAAAGGGL